MACGTHDSRSDGQAMTERKSPLAGKLPPATLLANVPRLVTAYYSERPDPAVAAQRVAFGTSGHRGSAYVASFNETHLLAIAQAVCLHRKKTGIDGPLYLGIDTHALSEPAFASVLEVLAANGVETMIDAAGGYTPTPVVSHAILTHNRGRSSGLADGIVISPSHNPPEDGGIKYNPPNGGPADTDVTGWIEKTANDLIARNLDGVSRMPLARARKAACVHAHDFLTAYVEDLPEVVDVEAIRASGVKMGIDPLGGASVAYWNRIVERFGLTATVVNQAVDPTFRFVTVDWDGKIRMDCSSVDAMQPLVGLRHDFDVAVGNDTDADRHGIVCPSSGLMNPNHYLTASIAYLFRNRPGWQAGSGIGKTIVSSGMIDRVAKKLGIGLREVPVGFKWFVDGLFDGSLGFVGEESAGASFLRRDGTVWTTDKDGLIMGLLAAEMTARTGKDPSRLYAEVTADLGTSYYERIDAPASDAIKAALKGLSPEKIKAQTMAGEPIEEKLDKAPGNHQAIGGIKVTTRDGWFAARPSGTEAVYKIYAESFRSADHLKAIQKDAQALVDGLK
jgi:phosphoglucomutase